MLCFFLLLESSVVHIIVYSTRVKVGPRKYKRRRKLKPEELESLRKSKNDTTGTGKSASKRASRKRGTSEHSELYYR